MCDVCVCSTYGSTTGVTSAAWCSGTCTCASGSYCPLGSSSQSGVLCPAGFYCYGTTNPATPCPVGSYGSTTGLSTPACTAPCPPGTYGATMGLSVCTQCPMGTFSSGTGLSSASACSGRCNCGAGSYCPLGSTSGASCTVCPAGSFCLGAGNGTTLCSAGCVRAPRPMRMLASVSITRWRRRGRGARCAANSAPRQGSHLLRAPVFACVDRAHIAHRVRRVLYCRVGVAMWAHSVLAQTTRRVRVQLGERSSCTPPFDLYCIYNSRARRTYGSSTGLANSACTAPCPAG